MGRPVCRVRSDEDHEEMNMLIRTLILLTIAAVAVACGKPAEKPAEAEPSATTPAAEAKPAGEEAPAAEAKPTEEAPAAARPRIEGPVATVNGVPIDSKAFYTELDKITSRGAKIPPERLARIEQNILKRLVEKELVRQSVAAAGIKVEEADIADAYEEYKKRFQTDEQFQNYLKHGRVTEASIRDRITDKRSLEKLIESRGNLGVEDKQAKEFYTKNERFYVEKGGVRASHILVKLSEKSTPEQNKAAMEKVKKVQSELKSGKSFADVAKKYSEGPSAPKGGDLGFFGAGQMVKPFEEAAFKMKVGETSAPVKTRFGLHIIKVGEKREERKKPFSEVKEQIVQTLKNKRFFQERRKLLEDLRKEAKITRALPDPPPAAKTGAAPGKPGLPAGHPHVHKPGEEHAH
jgi:peptidyl-prolyl cis-trans isomerase C